MRQVLEFAPHYTAAEALREFAGRHRLEPYVTDGAGLTYDEERLRDTIERRRRVRQRSAANSGPSDLETMVDEGEEEFV
jgi:hypothetical protein